MAVPAIIHAEHNVVRTLRRAGAVTPDAARPLMDLRRLEQRAAERLLAPGVLREAAPGRYWLDENAYGVYRGERRHRAMLVIIAMGIVILLLVILGIVKM
ncbi:hypothetical protein [Longimicrobium sp.]|uniref:hypothetical protein n=1 Tax=Longimicrobium sp. TaxID=2029185 RepID=UPI002C040DB6|nr:hypothetical protein [Longimicrobium sp.]HSU12851.1 hypothetical protein [Longimicrobium sp.]